MGTGKSRVEPLGGVPCRTKLGIQELLQVSRQIQPVVRRQQ
jgi:hypothetical protein